MRRVSKQEWENEHMHNPMTEGEALAVDVGALHDAAKFLAGRYSDHDGWVLAIRAAASALTAAQQPVQEGGGCMCDPTGADGQACPDATGTLLCCTAPPSSPVGVDGLAGLLEQIRDLLASLPVDCLGTDTSADGQPYPIRDEVIHSITKALAQQPAQAAPGWKLVPVEPTQEMVDAFQKAHDEHAALRIPKVYAKGQREAANVIVGYRAMLAATPPGDDAAGGGQ